mgnify:CR=1 FL=1
MPIDALLFDMDGVLVDTEPLHEDATRDILQRYALSVPDDLFDRFRGRPDRDLFAERLEEAAEADVDVPTLVREKAEVYETLLDNLAPRPGIPDLLRFLGDRSVPKACVTSATRTDQRAVFDRCGFDSLFDAVVTADDVERGKPHPEPYRRGAGHLGVDPDRCCVVEDSPYGIRAALEAQCIAVGIPTSYPEATLRDAGASFVTGDTPALQRWLSDRLSGNGRA